MGTEKKKTVRKKLTLDEKIEKAEKEKKKQELLLKTLTKQREDEKYAPIITVIKESEISLDEALEMIKPLFPKACK